MRHGEQGLMGFGAELENELDLHTTEACIFRYHEV